MKLDIIDAKKHERRSRMAQIRTSVQDVNRRGLGVDYEKLIAEISLNFSVARRTAKEYIDTLIKAGQLVKEATDVWTKEDSDLLNAELEESQAEQKFQNKLEEEKHAERTTTGAA